MYIAGYLIVVATRIIAHHQFLQIGGVLKAALLYVSGRTRQDDGLQLVAIVEHETARFIIFIQVVVESVTLEGVRHVPFQFGIVEIQVAQLTTGGVAIVDVSTAQEAQHADVETIERTAHGERVDVIVGSLQVHQIVAVHHGLQTELLRELSWGSGGHHLGEGCLSRVGHDVVLIVGPFLLVGIHSLGRHIDLKAFRKCQMRYRHVVHEFNFGISESILSECGGLTAQTAHGLHVKVVCKGIFLYLLHGNRDFYLAQVTILEGIAADALDGRRQFDGCQVLTGHEPRAAYIVEASCFKPFEFRELLDVGVSGESVVEPFEAFVLQSTYINEIRPFLGDKSGTRSEAQVFQHLSHRLIARNNETGQKLILIDSPCRVSLEPGHLLGLHLEADIRTIRKHVVAQFDLLWSQGLGIVLAKLPRARIE